MHNFTADLKVCPHCQQPVVMHGLVDEDDRRFWVRTIECDTCDITMREGISWGLYKTMTPEEAEDHVGKSLAAKWNRRDLPEPEDDKMTDDEKLALLAEIKSERANLAFHIAASNDHRQQAGVFADTLVDLRAKLAHAERVYGEHARDADYETEMADAARRRIEAHLDKLDADE